MKKKPFELTPSPFRLGRFDEQASTSDFESYVGGTDRAQRLFRIYKESYPEQGASWDEKTSKADVFRRKARQHGFDKEDAEALLLLQTI